GPAAGTASTYSLDELKRGFEQVEVVAVCQCSGNRRGLSDPHVPGVEWGYGAMGNAKWKGARLKDVLARGTQERCAGDRARWRRRPGAGSDARLRKERAGLESAR